MFKIPPVLKPVNRHLTIVPHSGTKDTDNTTPSGVILPDGFEPEEARYVTATVVDVAADCSSAMRQLRGSASTSRVIVVDASMIEEVVVKDKSYYTVLENYVVGIMRGIDEN
jgi:hypothetical protein